MADVLIRDVPDEVVAAIDSAAKSLGLSRTEYLRRALARERYATGPVTVSDLAAFSERFGDLLDPAVIERAWQ
jgi:ribosome maturation factor RimP